MKKHQYLNFQFGSILVVYLAVLSFLIPAHAIAQAKNAPKRSKYVMFKVTVKGNGQTEDGVTWSVDRVYESEGLIELDKFGPIVSQGMSSTDVNLEMAAANDGSRNVTYKSPLRITINDSYKSIVTQRCPSPKGGYYETTTITRTWKGSDVVKSGMTTGVKVIKPVASTDDWLYNVSLPLFVTPGGIPKLTYVEEKEVTGKPTEKSIELRSLSTVQVPIVNGLLDYPLIHHAKDKVLDPLSSGVTFDSGQINPSEPAMPNIKDSQQGVKVQVTYRYSYSPFTSISAHD